MIWGFSFYFMLSVRLMSKMSIPRITQVCPSLSMSEPWHITYGREFNMKWTFGTKLKDFCQRSRTKNKRLNTHRSEYTLFVDFISFVSLYGDGIMKRLIPKLSCLSLRKWISSKSALQTYKKKTLPTRLRWGNTLPWGIITANLSNMCSGGQPCGR